LSWASGYPTVPTVSSDVTMGVSQLTKQAQRRVAGLLLLALMTTPALSACAVVRGTERQVVRDVSKVGGAGVGVGGSGYAACKAQGNCP